MVSVTRRLVPVLFVLFAVASPCVYAQRGATADPVAPTYMGRVIAQTMHYTGAEWLVRDNRELEERSSLVVANLGVKPGMTVCDMGCGNGYYTLKLAEMAGREGRVLAVDIQPEMLHLLELRTKELGVTNVRPVLGTVQDPGLPDGEVDLIFCVDVYHEFSQPEEMLAAMRRTLKPEGLLVLVEFRAEDPAVPIKPLHKMSKAQNQERAAPQRLSASQGIRRAAVATYDVLRPGRTDCAAPEPLDANV